MTFSTIDELAPKEISAGLDLCAGILDKLMLTFVDFEPGVTLSQDKHPHEQIKPVAEAALAITLDEETEFPNAGQGVTVPSKFMNSAQSLAGPARAVDALLPVRADYIRGPAQRDILLHKI